MVTRADILKAAHWKARLHSDFTDTLTPDQWAASIECTWRRMWSVHPEAFHVEGELVSRLPKLPTDPTADVPMLHEWLDVFCAGVAADAMGAVAVGAEDTTGVQQLVQDLNMQFSNGLMT